MVRMVDDNEVTKKPMSRPLPLLILQKKTSKEMRLGAMEYAEGVWLMQRAS